MAAMRVLALESRRAVEMAALIRKRGAEAFVAPSMREAPLGAREELAAFARRLESGGFDMMILLTGVGTRLLDRALGPPRLAEALRRVAVVARGPKPVAALREMAVPVTIAVPEPNTWREILAATEGRGERRIAVQEYGKPSPDLVRGLEARGATVTAVRVYQWDLPEDTGPLREAARRLARGEFDAALFTTSVQVAHLFRIAAEEGVEDAVRLSLQGIFVGSIGPATTEALEEFSIHPAMEPSHPKMGLLVQEALDRWV